ncbi:MAG: hypothetical protein M3R63_04380 [Actinomycetota bacterium]|nr:hypothetical protein [Actinomycetota bacterium]
MFGAEVDTGETEALVGFITSAGPTGRTRRQCNVGEVPRQIVIFLGIDGEDGVRCFGGTLGSINLNNAPVFDVFSGGYTGVVDCSNDLHFSAPTSGPSSSTPAKS